jgi:hypothetical protein
MMCEGNVDQNYGFRGQNSSRARSKWEWEWDVSADQMRALMDELRKGREALMQHGDETRKEEAVLLAAMMAQG